MNKVKKTNSTPPCSRVKWTSVSWLWPGLTWLTRTCSLWLKESWLNRAAGTKDSWAPSCAEFRLEVRGLVPHTHTASTILLISTAGNRSLLSGQFNYWFLLLMLINGRKQMSLFQSTALEEKNSQKLWLKLEKKKKINEWYCCLVHKITNFVIQRNWHFSSQTVIRRRRKCRHVFSSLWYHDWLKVKINSSQTISGFWRNATFSVFDMVFQKGDGISF